MKKQSPKIINNGSAEHSTTHHQLKFRQLGESIVQSLPLGIVAFDKELRIIETNQRTASLIHLDEQIDQSLAKGTDEKIWGGWTTRLKAAIAVDTPTNFENVGYKFDGKNRLLYITCTPLKETQTNQSIGGALVIEDITEKVHIQRRLANTERLASVGKLASKVAHELNNPMDGILRYLNLSMRILEKENLAKPKEYLQQCRGGLMRMVQIVSELLEFSRGAYSAFEYTQVEKIIDDAVKSLELQITAAKVEIQRNYASNSPPVRSGNLFQVFCNLVKNAVDAMSEGGQLKIATSQSDDEILAIEFKDTGPGFPPENAEAIFEPFFTTKAHGKGTGLGLAICKDIVEKYDGRITAVNSPEGGSIFTVYIPLTAENILMRK